MPTSSARLIPETTAFLQRRVATFAALAAGLGLAFGVQRVFQLLTIGAGKLVWTPSLVYHLTGTAAMALLFGLTWFGRRSAPFIRAAEVLLFSASCVAFTAMAAEMPQVFRPNFTMLLGSVMLLLMRSIWVPSTWRWTALVSVLVGVPLLTTVWQRFEQIDPALLAAFAGHDDFFEVTPRNVRIDNLVVTAMWFTVAALIASFASGVIYGLRREVRKAHRLGQYILEEKLGAGGMGVVYRARHLMLRRPTAVKLLAGARVGEQHLTRFEREVQMSSKLTHPNTVDIYDYGRTPDGVFYYAMEHMNGPNLQELVERFGRVPPARVIHVLVQLCGALAEAHETGLIHRDIKPANIILTHRPGAHDLPKLLDFGLVRDLSQDDDVRLTRENAVIGTPLYLCPEMITGSEVDGRSDLYSLGAVAYFMLTGSPVFEGKTTVEVCGRHLSERPTPLSQRVSGIPPDLEELVLACLAKEPDERPADAMVLREALESCQDAGAWRRHDADAWWHEHGETVTELQRSRAETVSTSGSSIAIDFGRRATPRSG